MEIEVVEGLFGASIHVFKVESKRFFDSDWEMMFAKSFFVDRSMTIDLRALLVDGSTRAMVILHKFSLSHANRWGFVPIRVRICLNIIIRFVTCVSNLRVVLWCLASHCGLFKRGVANLAICSFAFVVTQLHLSQFGCIQSIREISPSVILELLPRYVCCRQKENGSQELLVE